MPLNIEHFRSSFRGIAHNVRQIQESDITETPKVRIFHQPDGGYLEELTRKSADGSLRFKFSSAIELIRQRLNADGAVNFCVVDTEYFHHPSYPEAGSSPSVHQLLMRASAGDAIKAEPGVINDAEKAGYTALARSWPVGLKIESWPPSAIIAMACETGVYPRFLEPAASQVSAKLGEIQSIIQGARSKPSGSTPFTRLVASLKS